MYSFLKGLIAYKSPAYIVLEVNGVGYHVNISLNTYTKIEKLENVKLNVELIVKEDSMTLYGFYDQSERNVFRLLLNVNGVGANTARLILSGLSAQELEAAILQEDVSTLTTIKGIGKKTAQRLILDLKDKIRKGDTADIANLTDSGKASVGYKEAQSALENLGFPSRKIKQVISAMRKDKNDYSTTEEIVKQALKNLS